MKSLRKIAFILILLLSVSCLAGDTTGSEASPTASDVLPGYSHVYEVEVTSFGVLMLIFQPCVDY